MSIRDNELILAGRMFGRRPGALRKAMEEMWSPTWHERQIFIMVDGVLANFPDHFMSYLGLPRYPLTSMEDPRLVTNYYKVNGDTDFWLTIPPFEKIEEFMPVSTYVVARHPELTGLTEKWLTIHGYPQAPLLNLWREAKTEVIPQGAYLLEDDVLSFERLREKHHVNVYLIDRPWNQEYKTEYRVKTVAEFYTKVMKP